MLRAGLGVGSAGRGALRDANDSMDSYRAKARAMMEEKDRELDKLRRKVEELEYSSAPSITPEPVAVPAPAPVAAPEPEPVFVPPPPPFNADADAKMTYLKNVVIKLLCTDDWEQQDALVPILGAMLEFTNDDSRSIKEKRAEIAPLVVKIEEGLRYVGLIGDTTAKPNPPPPTEERCSKHISAPTRRSGIC